MKKKFFTLILSVIILALVTLPVFAIQPRWSYTSSVTFNMYFSNGVGSIEGCVLGDPNVTQIEGTVTLYYKNFLGIWVKSGDKWNLSSSSDTLFIDVDFDAESGESYKAELDVDVYSGSNSENITDDTTGTCP